MNCERNSEVCVLVSCFKFNIVMTYTHASKETILRHKYGVLIILRYERKRRPVGLHLNAIFRKLSSVYCL